jgi:hypothetical protein
MSDLIPVRLRVEAAASSKDDVLTLLKLQAQQFFGDEEHRLDGGITVEVESYVDTMRGERGATRWAGTAYYINYREERP